MSTYKPKCYQSRYSTTFVQILHEIGPQQGQVMWRQKFPYNATLKGIHETAKGRILMGFHQGGGKGLRLYESVDSLVNGPYQQFLPNISVSQVFKDSKNGFWFSTIENGVF